MENKRQTTAESDGSILSDLDQMNLADFAFDEFEVNSNDGTEEIEKVELKELEKEMEVMKLASKSDSNEIAYKLDGKIDHLENYQMNEGQDREPFQLPEAIGEIVVQQEKVFVPTKQFPEYNFVGRILGPRGKTAKQLEAETGCKIMIRGRGSMKDKKKEEMNWGKPNWEHLNEELHVCIQSEDTPNRNAVKIAKAIEEVNKLLVPLPDGKDDLKRKQLRELAIINGTFRNGIKKEIGQKDHKNISPAKIITLEELEDKIVGLKQTKAMDQQSAIEDFANLKMWDFEQKLPPVNATNSSNAKPTKAQTVLENVNTTELKKAISNLFGYCAGCEQGFLMNDWARQVGDLQYHVRCFKCHHCRRRLNTDEEFVQDSKVQRKNRALGKMVPRILCKKDHIYFALKNKPTQMDNAEKVGDPVAKNPYPKWQID